MGPLLSTFVHRIATGAWAEGERLPSVRAAGERLGVDRRTVLAAYRELERRGLARREPRRGFFVSPGPALDRLGRHRAELLRLHARLRRPLDASGLHPAAALRFLARLEEEREAERPRCAFVECTRNQAEGHAREVHARLGVPCLALSLAELGGRAARAPQGVRTLLLSRFHAGELLEARGGPALLDVPVEADPELARRLPGRVRSALILETDPTEAEDLVRDAAHLDLPWRVEPRVVTDVDAAVRRLSAPGRVLLLSPRLFGWLAPALRSRAGVHELRFRVAASAWTSIADALGLPLGSGGS